MASCTTSLWGTTSSCPRLIFTVNEKSSTDTTVTLEWTLQYYCKTGVQTRNSKEYSAVIAGQTVASGSYTIGGKTGTHTIKTGITIAMTTKIISATINPAFFSIVCPLVFCFTNCSVSSNK